MGIVAESKRIKEIHPDYLILYKSGNFYKAFGKDAYILSALFDDIIKMNHITEELKMLIDKPYVKEMIRKIKDILEEGRVKLMYFFS